MALFHRHYVWNGPSGGEFNEYRNWTPVYRDHQPPSDNDLVIFNSGGALTIDGQSGLVAEIDVVLGTTLTILNGLEATGSITGVALSADSGGTVIVGNGAEMIGIGAVDVIGFRGVGTVLVTAGGLMDDNGMVLGDRAGGTGVVTVDGPGSQLVVANNLPGQPNGVLIVGNADTGTLGSVDIYRAAMIAAAK
jgi:T5SS/PEP-CTERM-associated repeat protein